MSLMDEIEDLCRAGKIPRQFRVEHVRKHVTGYADKHIRTVLAHYAADTGDQVKRWSKPRFRRVSRGLYSIS
jgi:hypothetical protein